MILYNIFKLKKLLNEYKDGKRIDGLYLHKLQDEIDLLLNNNLLNEYELSLLKDIHPRCKTKLESLSKNIKNESVLCYKNRQAFLDTLHTFINITNDLKMVERVICKDGLLLNRRKVEYDTNIIQIIPYIMIIHNNDLLLLERKKGDSRLINHIDFPAGHCNSNNIRKCIYTELNEELCIEKDQIRNIEFVGLIPECEDIFSVSYYHLGMIYKVDLSDDCIIKNGEKDRHNIIYLKDIKKDISKLKNIGDWATYGILKYLELKNNK